MPDRLRTLLSNLQRSALFPHPVDNFELLETHISFVLLTGPFAYKFKKPVDFGFVDFSTLERRRHYCEEELRLNRRFAPELYRSVVSIHGSVSRPHFDTGEGAIEFAVKMRQFPAAMRLDALVDLDRVSGEQFRDFAADLAGFHERAERADSGAGLGTPELIEHFAMENFIQTRSCATAEPLQELEDWTRAELTRLRPDFLKRLRGGWIRECHGDMHLANMVMDSGRITLFDCLEFNDELRWIDTASEIAFLVMDLHYRGHSALAHAFLSAYLEHCGDYELLTVLPLYLSYRAMVRAKVACLRRAQSAADPALQQEEIDKHLRLAQHLGRAGRGSIGIMFGLSGSGKSVFANRIVEHTGAIRLRSDVERRRLFDARRSVGVGEGRYGAAQIDQVYRRLEFLAKLVVNSGYHAIVDATFLQRSQRERFAALAQTIGVPFYICACQAPDAVLNQRVEKREHTGKDASEAGLSVLEYQRHHLQDLTAGEESTSIRIDTSRPEDLDAALSRIAARMVHA